MIKLFRNIRKKLIEQGKTANYLKYAIGKIILVIIIKKYNQNLKTLTYRSLPIPIGRGTIPYYDQTL